MYRVQNLQEEYVENGLIWIKVNKLVHFYSGKRKKKKNTNKRSSNMTLN